MKILKANLHDLPVILEIQQEAYQLEAAIYNDYNIPPLKQNLISLEEEFQKGLCVLKAEINREIVGSVRGSTQDGTSYIGRLIVKKDKHNQGIGQALMKAIETSLSNCHRYELFTGFKSEKNLYLYQKMGYKVFKEEFVNEKLTLIFLEKNN